MAKKSIKAAVSAAGTAGVALAGAAAIGVAPPLSVSPQLTASLHYLRGTSIGYLPSEQMYQDFIGKVIDGAGVTPPDSPYQKVDYNAGFWPVSHGGFRDLTFNKSVRQGVAALEARDPAAGDVIFGFSQGAVVASQYKETHTGNTYVLVSNPNRPNGGVMQRFKGITIPIVDFTFNGATPDNGDLTYDIVRQYDGWADFPTYLWNPVAVANAIMGIVFVHGNTQLDLTAEDLETAKSSGDRDYYQFDADSNTHYYVLKTYPVPLLMPVAWLPDPIIAALDAPLRKFIELAYDRSDYSVPKRSTFFAPLKPLNESAPIVEDQPEVVGDPAAGSGEDVQRQRDDEVEELSDETEELSGATEELGVEVRELGDGTASEVIETDEAVAAGVETSETVDEEPEATVVEDAGETEGEDAPEESVDDEPSTDSADSSADAGEAA